MHLTKQQIQEIAAQLASDAVKDTQFPDAEELHGYDSVPIIQDGLNKKISMQSFVGMITGDLNIDCGTSTENV